MDHNPTAPRTKSSPPIYAASANEDAGQQMDWTHIFDYIAREPNQMPDPSSVQPAAAAPDTQPPSESPSIMNLNQIVMENTAASLRNEYLTQVAQRLHLQQPQTLASSILQQYPNLQADQDIQDTPTSPSSPVQPVGTQPRPIRPTELSIRQSMGEAASPQAPSGRKRQRTVKVISPRPSKPTSKPARASRAQCSPCKCKKTPKKSAGKNTKKKGKNSKEPAKVTSKHGKKQAVKPSEVKASQPEPNKAVEREDKSEVTLRSRRSVKPSLTVILPKREPIPDGPQECGTCKHLCKNKRALGYHVKRIHGNRKWTCCICLKVYTRPDSLKKHIDGTHGGPHNGST
jgi:hypothetical protein